MMLPHILLLSLLVQDWYKYESVLAYLPHNSHYMILLPMLTILHLSDMPEHYSSDS
jgi:hypothetical protein